MDTLESILARACNFEARFSDFAVVAEMARRQVEAYEKIGQATLHQLANQASMLPFSRDMEIVDGFTRRAKRRRKGLEAALERNSRCKRCRGVLEIRDETCHGTIVRSSLVCNKCNYTRLESPEYSSCHHADAFLEAAEQLKGKPPLPASYTAYQACELYLRELGGCYYHPYDNDASDESDFVSPSSKHSLRTLRGKMEESRRDRLDAKDVNGKSFKTILLGLPQGLWQLLRYGETHSLKPCDGRQSAEASIGKDGRLLINEQDVYEILTRMASVMKGFVAEEFRRNLGLEPNGQWPLVNNGRKSVPPHPSARSHGA